MTREQRHEAIRASGMGEHLDRLIATLDGHAEAFREVIQIADRGHASWAVRTLLDGCKRRAEHGLLAIEWTLDRPTILGPGSCDDNGHWGDNGKAPNVQALLRDARFYAQSEGGQA